MKSDSGIALVTLVITIIVLGILATVSLSGALGNESIVDRAKAAIFKSELRDLKDSWDARKADIDESKLNFDNLEDVLDEKQIPENLRGKLKVKDGILVYKIDTDSEGNKIVSDKERAWMEEIGVKKPFDSVDVRIIATVGVNSAEAAKPKDVVLVIDTSTALTDASYTNSSKKRYEDLVPALNALMNNILTANAQNRVSIVQYASSAQVILPLDHYTLSSGTSYFTVNTSANTEGDAFATTNSYVKNSSGAVCSGISLYLGTGTSNIQAAVATAENNVFKGRSSDIISNYTDAMFIFTNSEPHYVSVDYEYANLASIANSSNASYYENSAIASYYTIKLINEIRFSHDIDIYTVNYTGSNIAKLTMDPSAENLALVTADSEEFKSFYELHNSDPVVSYARSAHSGELSATELYNVFANFGTKIATGEIQTSLENFTTGSTVILNSMMTYDDPATNTRITYKIKEDEQMEVKVTATIFDSNGNSTLQSASVTRLYSYEDIVNGVEPNLSINSQGGIKWDITASLDTENSNSIRNEVIKRLKNAYTLGEGETIEISDVEVKIPVYEVNSVPLS